jgi:transcriptional antiterminator
MKTYEPAIEIEMKLFFATLTEKEKRQYAALEALKVGYGGQTYIAQVLGISTKTIQRGLREIAENNRPPADRIRRKGGGRKPFDQKKSS